MQFDRPLLTNAEAHIKAGQPLGCYSSKV